MPTSIKMPSVVSIGGSGRNGSTWLGLCLERSPDVCFAGELTHLWQRGFLDDERCGCRRPFSRYDFWHAVTQEAFGRLPTKRKRPVEGTRHHPACREPAGRVANNFQENFGIPSFAVDKLGGGRNMTNHRVEKSRQNQAFSVRRSPQCSFDRGV